MTRSRRHEEHRFCPACGGTLAARPETPHPRCSHCGHVVYLDPKTVACVVVDIGGKILLMRRKRPSDAGRWLLPGGYVNRGEPVKRAAVREIREETGLSVEPDALVGVFSYADWPPVVIVYSARLERANPVPGEEAEALTLFAPDEIPWDGLAFPSTRDALRTYLTGLANPASRLYTNRPTRTQQGQFMETPSNFLRAIIEEDLAHNRNEGRVVTRFPPEPNGFLHIGHAKSICLNFGLARDYGGRCHLRFDDTNPGKEDPVYVESIKEDVRWLGFDWGSHLHHASDYFERLYGFAVELIRQGKAYVCSLPPEEMRRYRGTLTEPGVNSPYRDRPVEENLDLFARMRAGEFPEGAHVLRAKIDMASPNMNMRDPALYRILHQEHQNTGSNWCIYPMYDFAHGLSDALEHITHSICTLEFADHRPLYDWILDQLDVPARPRQYEFNRLNINYTVTSKRKLKQLVDEGLVSGWDDPRMPTISGMRRRGFPPAALRDFCERIGVSRSDSCVDMSLLENCVREELDATAPRAMAVLRPLRVVIENYPEDREEFFDLPNHPKNPDMGGRKAGFSREIFIERDDFMESPCPKFFRLAPGREVRLRGAYLITCTGVRKGPDGEIEAVICSYDPQTRGGDAPDGRKVKGTLHWVGARHGRRAEIRLYDRLFMAETPGKDADFLTQINPHSLVTLTDCVVEESLTRAAPEDHFQFERQGYFCADRFEHTPEKPVFNRTVGLRDSWSKATA